MVLITLMTFNLGEAMAFGFFAYSVMHIIKTIRNAAKLNWYLICSAFAIIGSIVIQYLMK
jgi:hypothetical protein